MTTRGYPHPYLGEYTSLTPEEAARYCAGSEHQRVREEIARRVGARTVLDYGCGPGIDAPRYAPDRYVGVDASAANVNEARRRHPEHRFRELILPLRDALAGEGPFLNARGYERPDCVMIKSVLEHTPDAATATALLRDAMRLAREVVFVAWHTPPRRGADEVRELDGHFGRAIWQNSYALEHFAFATPRYVDRVDVFELWEIPGDGT